MRWKIVQFLFSFYDDLEFLKERCAM